MRFLTLLLAACFLPATASAACKGEDLMARLATEDPAAHAAILEAASEVPNGDSRFWRIERDGGEPSWLLGTYHDTETIASLTPAIEQALSASDRIVVELSPDEKARMQERVATDPSFAFDFTGNGLAARLPPEDLARAEAALAKRGMTLEVVDKLRPWMLFALLGIPACQIAQVGQGEPVMDEVLIARATGAGKAVVGLETYEQALGSFDLLDPEIALESARDLLRLAEIEEDVRRTLQGLYTSGRIAAIAEFSDYLSAHAENRPSAKAEAMAEAFRAALIDQRNEAWMEALLPAIEEGGSFVAVGALHLPGEKGLVELLRAEGYEVTRAAE